MTSELSGPDPFSRKPQDNVFTQQRLHTFSPVPSPNSIILTLFGFAAFFLIIGGVITAANEKAYSVSVRYDNLGNCVSSPNCTVNFTIHEDMNKPVYVYYILNNFYQNYRRYVKSHVDTQLRGLDIYSDLSACEPLDTYKGNSLYPCGLVAYSMFNDTFSGAVVHPSSGGPSVQLMTYWSEDGIAFPLDKSKKFRNPEDGQTIRNSSRYGPYGVLLPNVTDEHFIVWMRVAALPNFRKLYARLDYDLKKGDTVSLIVANNFPPKQKYLALTTISNLGVANPFIEAMYYTVGTFCAIVGLGFFLKHKFVSSRALGVVKYYQIHLPRVMSRNDVELKGIERKQDSGPMSPTPISHDTSGSH